MQLSRLEFVITPSQSAAYHDLFFHSKSNANVLSDSQETKHAAPSNTDFFRKIDRYIEYQQYKQDKNPNATTPGMYDNVQKTLTPTDLMPKQPQRRQLT